MPRVAINKKKYMCQDLHEWISGKMSRFEMNQTEFGKLLGITQPSAYERLKGLKEGKDTLKSIELAVIFKKFEATDEEILKFMKL